MSRLRAVVTYLVLFFPLSSLAQVSVDVRFNYKRGSYKGCYYDVVVTKNGKEYNISMFHPWEHIEQVLLSPDQHYMIVWHKPQSGRAYLLSVYDLEKLCLIKRIAPGYGGDFSWNDRHQLIHQWGCGTNCANFRIYDLNLHEVFYTLSSGGFLLSPANDFLVQYAMHGDRMWVYDLRHIKRGANPRVYTCDIAAGYSTDQIRFTHNSQIELFSEIHLKHKYIDLDTVNWKRLAPKDIGEYYNRQFSK